MSVLVRIFAQYLMSERGIFLAHSTILRWVQQYTPEFETTLCPAGGWLLAV
jgi:transposase-like protein